MALHDGKVEYPNRRHLAKWLAGFGTSLIGDQLYFVCLAWAAVQTANPSTVGLVLAAGAIPRALSLLAGGILADRVSLKLLIMASDGGRALSAFAVGALLASGQAGVSYLVMLAVAFGILDGIFLPAVNAAPQRLAAPRDMARVQGSKTVVQRLSIVVGAPLAGWVVASYGLHIGFYLCAIFFILSLSALATIRLAQVERVSPGDSGGRTRSWRTDVVEGFYAIRRERVLVIVLVVLTIADFGFAGPLNTGLPILVHSRAWDAIGLGYLLGAFGLGAALTGLSLAAFRTVNHPLAIVACSLAMMAAALVGLGLSQRVDLAVVLLFCFGLGSGAGATLLNTMLMNLTPTDKLGRVMSVSALASYGGIPFSYALSGWLAAWFGPAAPFFFGGFCAVVALIVAVVGLRGSAHWVRVDQAVGSEPGRTDDAGSVE